MMKNILTFLNVAALIAFIWYFGSQYFGAPKFATNEFRNLSFSGKVVNIKIDKDLSEKTHTIYLSDNTLFIVPHLDLDADIEIGDFLKKVQRDYKITIYKKGDSLNKIVYALPCIE